MATMDSEETRAAVDKLRNALIDLFSQADALNSTPIDSYSYDMAEDGETLVVYVTLTDNREVWFSFKNGQRVGTFDVPFDMTEAQIRVQEERTHG